MWCFLSAAVPFAVMAVLVCIFGEAKNAGGWALTACCIVMLGFGCCGDPSSCALPSFTIAPPVETPVEMVDENPIDTELLRSLELEPATSVEAPIDTAALPKLDLTGSDNSAILLDWPVDTAG